MKSESMSPSPVSFGERSLGTAERCGQGVMAVLEEGGEQLSTATHLTKYRDFTEQELTRWIAASEQKKMKKPVGAGEPEPTNAFATTASAPTGQMPFGLPKRQRFLTISLLRFEEHHTHDPGIVPLCFFGEPGLAPLWL